MKEEEASLEDDATPLAVSSERNTQPGTIADALVLIDFQEWIVSRFAPGEGRKAAGEGCRRAEEARAQSIPVMHVQYLFEDGSDGGQDSPMTRFVEPLVVLPGELRITKYGRSAFGGTHLHRELRARGITRLTLAGLVTDGGILETCEDAIALGYDVVLAENAMAGMTPAGHDEALARMLELGASVIEPGKVSR